MITHGTILLLLVVLSLSGCNRQEALPDDAAKNVSPVVAKVETPGAVVAPLSAASPTAAIMQSQNRPPSITALVLENPAVHRGVDIRVIPDAVDPDADLLQFHYRWFVNDNEIFLDQDTLAGDQFRKGDRVSVRVEPFDGKISGTVFFSKIFTIPNAPPRFVTTPPTQFKAAVYSYQAKAEDPDNDPLTYSLIEGPPGMEIDRATGSVTWKISKSDAGMHKVIIKVEDVEAMKSLQEWQLDISIE